MSSQQDSPAPARVRLQPATVVLHLCITAMLAIDHGGDAMAHAGHAFPPRHGSAVGAPAEALKAPADSDR